MKIKLIKFNDNLIIPTRAHYNDAGLDCYALEDITLMPNIITEFTVQKVAYNLTAQGDIRKAQTYFEINTIPLGFGLEVPDGYMATIRPRSSMNAKGIITQIGTIDSGYRGEIKVVLINLTDRPILISKGDKICQIVIEPVVLADLVEDLGEERKDGGFGSTDK